MKNKYVLMIIFIVCITARNIAQEKVQKNFFENNIMTVQEMEDNLKLNKFVFVPGIYFKQSHKKIKEESKPALKKIAQLFTKHPDKKYFIIVYTDFLGDFNFSIKLARNRAHTIVDNLIKNHNIQSSQITPFGVVALMPVSPDSTNDNKIRKKELVIIEH